MKKVILGLFLFGCVVPLKKEIRSTVWLLKETTRMADQSSINTLGIYQDKQQCLDVAVKLALDHYINSEKYIGISEFWCYRATLIEGD